MLPISYSVRGLLGPMGRGFVLGGMSWVSVLPSLKSCNQAISQSIQVHFYSAIVANESEAHEHLYCVVLTCVVNIRT